MPEEVINGEGANLSTETTDTSNNQDIEKKPESEWNHEVGKKPEDEKTTWTKEEVESIKKKMESDHDKWAQKLLKTNKHYETAMKEIKNIAKSQEKLVDLYESNPDAAKIILDSVYDGMSIDEFKTSIGYEEDRSDPSRRNAIIEKEANQKAQAKIEAKTIENATTAFVEKVKMTSEQKAAFLEAFEDRKTMRSFSVDKIDEHLLKAWKEVAPSDETIKKLEQEQENAKTLATGTGKQSTTKSPTSQEDRIQKDIEYNKKLLKENGIL